MEQYIGDGANLFITIVACLIGFGAAASAIDFRKSNEEHTDE